MATVYVQYGTIMLRKRSGKFVKVKNRLDGGSFDKVAILLPRGFPPPKWSRGLLLMEDDGKLSIREQVDSEEEWQQVALPKFIPFVVILNALLWATSYIGKRFYPGDFMAQFLERCGLKVQTENCINANALAKYFLILDRHGKPIL